MICLTQQALGIGVYKGSGVHALVLHDWERVYGGMGHTTGGVSKFKKRTTESGIDFSRLIDRLQMQVHLIRLGTYILWLFFYLGCPRTWEGRELKGLLENFPGLFIS